MIDSSNRFAFIGNRGYSPDNISKYKIDDFAEIEFVLQNDHGSLGANGANFEFDKEANRIYFAAGSGGTGYGYSTQVVDPTDLTKIADLSLGAYPNAVGYDSDYIYTGKNAYYDDDDIKVFDKDSFIFKKSYSFANGEVLLSRGISVGKSLYAATDKYLYYLSSSNSDKIKIYDFINEEYVDPNAGKPDLIIESLEYYSPNNTVPVKGAYVGYNAVIKNIGTAPAEGPIRFKAYLDGQYLRWEGFANNFVLNPGETMTNKQYSYTKFTVGEHTIKATVDSEDLVEELDEENNSAEMTFNITESEKPDLKITSAILVPNNVVYGTKDIAVYITRMNQSDFKPYYVKIYDKISGYTKSQMVTSHVQGNIDFNLQPGNYNFEITIDSTNVITESDETNNTYSKSVSIPGSSTDDSNDSEQLPDLVFVQDSFKYYITDGTQPGWPSSGIPLAYIELEDTSGTFDLSGLPLIVESGGKSEIFAGRVSGNVIGYTINLRFFGIEQSNRLYYNLEFKADPYNKVEESNETNNNIIKTVIFRDNENNENIVNINDSGSADRDNQAVLKLQRRISELERQVIDLEKRLTQIDNAFAERYRGTMFLDVENYGRLWYVDPESRNRYYFENGESALSIGSKLATGITYEDIQKIPIGVPEELYNLADSDGDGLPDRLESALGSDPNNSDTDGDGYSDKQEIANGYNPANNQKYAYDNNLVNRLEGKMLLQVSGPNSHGEIWYIHDGKRWYGGTQDSMYEIMKARSLGAKAEDIRKIEVGEVESE